MFFSFLAMSLSGLILYIAPPGRVFRWTNWHFLWLDLYQWQAIHTLFSYLFIGFAIAHVFSLNWKILFSYFTRKSVEGLRRKKELLAAIIVTILFLVGTTLNLPPFKSIMQIGDFTSEYWGKSIDYPPVAHTEDMTIEEIATVLLHIETADYLKRIENAGFENVGAHQKLIDVCELNNVAPYQFFHKTTKGLNVLIIPAKK